MWFVILLNSVDRYVYGARSTAAKTRRCGECEGCNREDCGKCVTCLDKPKFGGKVYTSRNKQKLRDD